MKFTSQDNLKFFWIKIKEKLSTVAFTGNYTDLANKPARLPASDVYSWAKAETKPTYNKSEIGLEKVDNTADLDKTVKQAISADSLTGINAEELVMSQPISSIIGELPTIDADTLGGFAATVFAKVEELNKLKTELTTLSESINEQITEITSNLEYSKLKGIPLINNKLVNPSPVNQSLVRNILIGTEEPNPSVGNNGDIYIQIPE